MFLSFLPFLKTYLFISITHLLIGRFISLVFNLSFVGASSDSSDMCTPFEISTNIRKLLKGHGIGGLQGKKVIVQWYQGLKRTMVQKGLNEEEDGRVGRGGNVERDK